MLLDPPGYFGKIPARGDFLSSRLPTGIAAPWDAWLERFTLSVREAAGNAWPEAWLTAPLWHFVLGPGVLGPGAMAGVLVASVDRVGRMYPFTIIGPTGGEPDESWSAAVEALVLQALADAFEPSTLDDALTQLGPPGQPPPWRPDARSGGAADRRWSNPPASNGPGSRKAAKPSRWCSAPAPNQKAKTHPIPGQTSPPARKPRPARQSPPQR